MTMTTRFRPMVLIATVFWIYVALSDVLYANRMQASLTAMHVGHLFAPWRARLLQHLFLYPALLGCMWGSLTLGWQPILRRLPLQILLGAVFAALGEPSLWLGLSALIGFHQATYAFLSGLRPGTPLSIVPVLEVWVASSTSFLLDYGFGLALVTGFDVYRRLRDTQIRSAALERALSAAHLAALRMQLSPHSLFNLLNTIHGQIDRDPSGARSMIVQLADLLRRLLHAGEREFSRLSEELQFARLYLTLQQRRFSDRLTVFVPEPEGLPAAWVPSLILQPLIENAVVHGIAKHPGEVEIRVQACASAEWLWLRVSNTLPAGEAGCGDGIGLKNVRERLAIQFGGRASFEAAPTADGRWLAEIRLPLIAEVIEPVREEAGQPQRAQRAAERSAPDPTAGGLAMLEKLRAR
jgi:signal transduction histidine kinase